MCNQVQCNEIGLLIGIGITLLHFPAAGHSRVYAMLSAGALNRSGGPGGCSRRKLLAVSAERGQAIVSAKQATLSLNAQQSPTMVKAVQRAGLRAY
jgi:hypothetical protein